MIDDIATIKGIIDPMYKDVIEQNINIYDDDDDEKFEFIEIFNDTRFYCLFVV